MLVLNNYYDDEFVDRKICRGANKHPFLHTALPPRSKVTEKDRKQECQIAVFSHSQNNNPRYYTCPLQLQTDGKKS